MQSKANIVLCVWYYFVTCFGQDLKLGWRVVVATIIGFVGSACGTVGGVGGGGIFVPMLNLVVGFDTKSVAALSKCMFIIYSLNISILNSNSFTCLLLVKKFKCLLWCSKAFSYIQQLH